MRKVLELKLGLSDEDADRLDALAERIGVARCDVLRMLVKAAHDRVERGEDWDPRQAGKV